MLTEDKIYVSCFVKDLNFDLARILVIDNIFPDTDRTYYEIGHIEMTSHCPIVEFRFILDKLNDETENEFKERCFYKMRDLLMQRTRGKI